MPARGEPVPSGSFRLSDPPGGTERSTATLVASLRDRLTVLGTVTGRDAIGSLLAGFAELGQVAARTAEGRRLARDLRAGRAAAASTAVWTTLGLDLLSAVTPTPVLEHLRNDLALLRAQDLEEALGRTGPPAGCGGPPAPPQPADPIDYLVGMWAFAREAAASIEALAEPRGEAIEPGDGPPALRAHEPMLR